MVLGRSQLSMVPLIGVLCVLFVFFSGMLTFETIHIPREFDCGHVEDPPCRPPRVHLHADGSVELGVYGETAALVEPSEVSRAFRHLVPCDVDSEWAVGGRAGPGVVQIAADEGVQWGQFVETVSSVSHITGGQVAVVSDED